MVGLAAWRDSNMIIHDSATLRAMPHGRVRATMIHVVAWSALHRSSRHVRCSFCSSRGSSDASSRRMTGITSSTALRPRAALRGTRPRNVRAPLDGRSRQRRLFPWRNGGPHLSGPETRSNGGRVSGQDGCARQSIPSIPGANLQRCPLHESLALTCTSSTSRVTMARFSFPESAPSTRG